MFLGHSPDPVIRFHTHTCPLAKKAALADSPLADSDLQDCSLKGLQALADRLRCAWSYLKCFAQQCSETLMHG